MKKQLIGLLFVCALVVQSAKSEDFTGKVVRVMDGDTIEVMKNGEPARIRFYGIDCPEKNQAFGQKAKQFVSALIFGEEVEIRHKGRDRYGRIIGEIIMADGNNLNHELVRAGLAWWYERFSPEDTDLENLEKQAQDTKTGLWSEENPIPPWDWRKGKR